MWALEEVTMPGWLMNEPNVEHIWNTFFSADATSPVSEKTQGMAPESSSTTEATTTDPICECEEGLEAGRPSRTHT